MNEFEQTVLASLVEIVKRLDAVDRRLGSVDQRFDSVDQRFDSIDQAILSVKLDLRKEIAALQREMNEGFNETHRVLMKEVRDIDERLKRLEGAAE